jgi:hypothetical protein
MSMLEVRGGNFLLFCVKRDGEGKEKKQADKGEKKTFHRELQSAGMNGCPCVVKSRKILI